MPHIPGHTSQANPFLDILEDEPKTAFFSRANKFGNTPQRRRFSENLFPSVFNRFLGQLGTQIRGGGEPTLRFNDFLDDLDFEKEFFRQSPTQRRGFGPTLNPRTRFLVQF